MNSSFSGPDSLPSNSHFVLTAEVTPDHKPRVRLKKEKDAKKEPTKHPLHSSHVILTQTSHSVEADTIVREQQTVCDSLSREGRVIMNMSDEINLRGRHQRKGGQDSYLGCESESR